MFHVLTGAADGGLDRVISDRQLAVIAKDYVTQWEYLAPFLGLTRPKEKEIAKSYPGDYFLQKRECLSVWKEMEGERATYRAFISAAEEAGDQQLAHTVRDLFSHTTGTVERDSDIVEDEGELPLKKKTVASVQHGVLQNWRLCQFLQLTHGRCLWALTVHTLWNL